MRIRVSGCQLRVGRTVFTIQNEHSSNKDQKEDQEEEKEEEKEGQEDIVTSTSSAPISASKMDKNSTSKQFYRPSNNGEHVLVHLSNIMNVSYGASASPQG